MNTFEALTPGSVAIILVGVAFLGGAIGSFLNVVIYRLPAGLSLNHPPSRCPKCEHPIRAYDNVPVLGWILLRGKCRDCGEPISVRYPTIEAIVMLTFLLVVWLEWFGLKVSVQPKFGAEFSLEATIARTGLHLLLLTTMLGVGMIEWDGGRIPRRIWLPVLLVAVVLWHYFPLLTIWPVGEYNRTCISLGWLEGASGAIFGSVTGGILFAVTSLCLKKEERPNAWWTLGIGGLCVGLVFGRGVVVGLGMIYLPILLVGCLLKRGNFIKRRLPYGLGWFLLILVEIVILCLVPF